MEDAALICRVPGDVGGLSRMIESPAVWSERRRHAEARRLGRQGASAPSFFAETPLEARAFALCLV